jgi:hypothetical protein
VVPLSAPCVPLSCSLFSRASRPRSRRSDHTDVTPPPFSPRGRNYRLADKRLSQEGAIANMPVFLCITERNRNE